jgi:hypothetical protein
MDFFQLYKSESVGQFESGIDIKISSPTGKTEGLRDASYKAAELLEQAIIRDFYANDKASQECARLERLELLNCFSEAHIFVQPIPNGYCRLACCEHRPWFQVTTRIGVITIGWRKSVICIDWLASTVAARAEELFPDENVTKDGRMIHAWGYEKAREYLARLFQPTGEEWR